jgi:hypothetical protein
VGLSRHRLGCEWSCLGMALSGYAPGWTWFFSNLAGFIMGSAGPVMFWPGYGLCLAFAELGMG